MKGANNRAATTMELNYKQCAFEMSALPLVIDNKSDSIGNHLHRSLPKSPLSDSEGVS